MSESEQNPSVEKSRFSKDNVLVANRQPHLKEEAYTKETVRQVWDDQNGDRIEVGPDRDGLGLVEIRYVDPDGKCGNSVSMTVEQARLVQEAFAEYLETFRQV